MQGKGVRKLATQLESEKGLEASGAEEDTGLRTEPTKAPWCWLGFILTGCFLFICFSKYQLYQY